MIHPFKCPKCGGVLKNNTWFCPYCESNVSETYKHKQEPHCFIATAAYGTPWHRDIDVLRNFRDDVLQQTFIGRMFIKTYYAVSPPLAKVVARHHGVRKIVRKCIKLILRGIKNKKF